jgi:hypothetical protein
MVDNNNHDEFPKVLIDRDNDFASIKLKQGIEAKSYLKDGMLFSEDDVGNIIEIQILSLKDFVRFDELIAS